MAHTNAVAANEQMHHSKEAVRNMSKRVDISPLFLKRQTGQPLDSESSHQASSGVHQ